VKSEESYDGDWNCSYEMQRKKIRQHKFLWMSWAKVKWEYVVYLDKGDGDRLSTFETLVATLHLKEIDEIKSNNPKWEWDERIAKVTKFHNESMSVVVTMRKE